MFDLLLLHIKKCIHLKFTFTFVLQEKVLGKAVQDTIE